MTSPDDQSCVRACLAGDSSAFEPLLARYKARVFSFILRLVGQPSDAEDLAQETFIKAFKGLRSYDTSRPMISWLFRIAHNATVDHRRRKDPSGLVSMDAGEEACELPDPGPSVETELEARSERDLADRLLSRLPEIYKEVILLRHKEGLEVADIARVLQAPEGTVKARLFRAREALKKALGSMQPPGEDSRTP